MRKWLLAALSALAITAASPMMTVPTAFAAEWDITKAAEPFKGTELNVIFLDRPGYRAIIKLLPEFEQKTGIKVNYEIVPYENTREKQVLNFNSKGDLSIALVDLVWMGEFAENGWIAPIDQFTKDPSITDPNLNLKGFFPLLLDAFGSWGGKVYGLPFDNYSGLLFYNKCMLKDAGFDKPPGTWEELDTSTRPSSPIRTRSSTPTRCSRCAARRSPPTASCACCGRSAGRCSTSRSTRTSVAGEPGRPQVPSGS